MAFCSWHYVRPSKFGWYDDEGNNVSVVGDQAPGEAKLKLSEPAYGIKLVVNKPERLGPVLQPEMPWENGGIYITSILKDQGLYRAWGSSDWGDLKGRGRNCFCYFESDDGLNWNRPECSVTEFEGTKNNNILGAKGGSVFIDPSAPPNERYKWIKEATFNRKEFDEYKKRRPDCVGSRCCRNDVNLIFGVQGAVSPDGICWDIIPQPLVMMHSDTHLVAYYDNILGKYVGYFRDWAVGNRADTDAGSYDKNEIGRAHV